MRSIGNLWREDRPARRTGTDLAAIAFLLAVMTACTAPSPAVDPAVTRVWPVTEPPRPGWQRLKILDAVIFDAPADTRRVAVQGIDSLVGAYATDRFTLTFDYGPYSNSLSDDTPWSLIDGQRARLEVGAGACQVLPDTPVWPLAASVHVDLKPNTQRLGLTMSGCAANEAGLEELRQIYASLRFSPHVSR